MKSHRWIVLLGVGGLILAGCVAPPTPAPLGPKDGTEVIQTGPATCHPDIRCRAWLFFNASNPVEAAGDLEKVLGEGGEAYVVVRADVVSGPYNLVVPVDAAGQSDFDQVLAMLADMVGSEPIVLIVDEHHPAQTTKANSYVTESERVGHEGDFPEPGRQVPNSPGANPWG